MDKPEKAPEWIDVSNENRREKDRVGESFRIKFQGFNIFLTRRHVSAPGMWVFHCYAMQFDTVVLQRVDKMTADEAKAAAVLRVYGKAMKIARQLHHHLNEIKSHEPEDLEP